MSLDAYYALCDLYYHYLHEFSIVVTHPRSDCSFMSLDAYYDLCDLYYHYLHEFSIVVTHPRSDCSFMSLDAYYALCDRYYHYLHESLLQSLALGVTAFPFLCRSSPLCHWTPIMLYVICIIIISMSSLL